MIDTSSNFSTLTKCILAQDDYGYWNTTAAIYHFCTCELCELHIFHKCVFLKVQLEILLTLYFPSWNYTQKFKFWSKTSQAHCCVIDQLCRELSVMTFWPKVWTQCVKCYFHRTCNRRDILSNACFWTLRLAANPFASLHTTRVCSVQQVCNALCKHLFWHVRVVKKSSLNPYYIHFS